jgi:hypothetical protein
VELSEDVEIGEYAFAYCDKLTTVKLGDNVIIADYAFYSPVDVSQSVEATGYFRGQYYETYDYTVTDETGNKKQTYTYYRYKFMDNVKSSLTTLELGENVDIGAYAFSKCYSLVIVEIPNSVQYLNEGMFASCGSLQTVVLPNSLKKIEAYIFTNTSLEVIVFKGNSKEWNKIDKHEDWDKDSKILDIKCIDKTVMA